MSVAKVTETDNVAAEPDLIARALSGEVFVARRGLQQAGLFDLMLGHSKSAVRALLGDALTDQVLAAGFEKIHDIVPPEKIPEVTEAIYAVAEEHAADYVRVLMREVFGRDRYYYESAPNVRFHIPFKQAKAHARLYAAYSEKRGEGKVTSHGPHRDSWLDCPDNGVNVWIALGRVRKGNGLTVFLNEYEATQTFTKAGEVTDREKLTEPATFDLEPGDFIVFHTDHLHGSELNRTDETRFVISFRVTFDKPRFPRGHYHPYHHAGLASGPLKALSTLPAWLQPSLVRSTAERAIAKVLPKADPAFAPETPAGPVGADLMPGEIRALDAGTCVARLADNRLVAFSRRCPHKGADLANGYVKGDRIVCPWHNLPFDSASGASACEGLKPLIVQEVEVVDGAVRLKPRAKRAKAPASA